MAFEKKIAVLGGSFNPVHFGHVSLARNVAGSGLVDEVWLSLSPRNPFKSRDQLSDTTQRLRLLAEALKDEPNLRYTDIELSLPEPSYTIDALDKLSELHPDCRFVWLIGSDNLPGLTKWKDWQRLLTSYGVIVYPRGEGHPVLPYELEQYARHITLLDDMPLYDISSTELRARQGKKD